MQQNNRALVEQSQDYMGNFHNPELRNVRNATMLSILENGFQWKEQHSVASQGAGDNPVHGWIGSDAADDQDNGKCQEG